MYNVNFLQLIVHVQFFLTIKDVKFLTEEENARDANCVALDHIVYWVFYVDFLSRERFSIL